MEWITRIYSDLRVPYLGVIGNHDMAAKGTTIFRQVFGELNYSFIYQGYKFICLNTNSREVAFDGTVPDLNWLNQQVQVQAGVRGTVAISHVTPFSVDFDPELEAGYVAALERSGNCLASLHAHDHKSGRYQPYPNRIPFIVSSAILEREFTLIEIINGNLQATEVKY
jgi:3',5'-cyclic-AMP phosphodiesterase